MSMLVTHWPLVSSTHSSTSPCVRVVPENAVGAVAGEIADAPRPDSRADAGRGPATRWRLHWPLEPSFQMSTSVSPLGPFGIGPKNVVAAVAEEVADPGDGPAAARMRTEIDALGPLAVGDLPLVDIAGGRVLPQDVARAVAGEIADADDIVAGRVRARTDARLPLAAGIELPDVGLHLAVAPTCRSTARRRCRCRRNRRCPRSDIVPGWTPRSTVPFQPPLLISHSWVSPVRRVLPQDVARPVAGEIAGAGDLDSRTEWSRAGRSPPTRHPTRIHSSTLLWVNVREIHCRRLRVRSDRCR